MTANEKKVFQDALKLPAKNRALLAEKLLASLEATALDESLDEAEHRLKAYDKGDTKAIPIEDVFPNLSRHV